MGAGPSRVLFASARSMAALTCIGQEQYESDPDRSHGVHEDVVRCIDDDVCLRAKADAPRDIVLTVRFDLDGEALWIANQPIDELIFGSQLITTAGDGHSFGARHGGVSISLETMGLVGGRATLVALWRLVAAAPGTDGLVWSGDISR